MGDVGVGRASARDAAGAVTDEVGRYLAAHPDTEAVEFLVIDSNGIVRGKWAPVSALPKAFSSGVNFPFSMLGLDVWGREVMETGLHVDTGDRDGFCRAGPGTLRTVPWAPRPTAQALLSMHTERGEPFVGDPRNCLAGVLQRFRARGLNPVCAVELEFYLLDPRMPAMGDGMMAPVYRSQGGPVPQNMYAMSDLADHQGLFSDIWAFGREQGLPLDTMISEAAPGQFEVNLKHVPDALAAADDAIMLKRLITETARKHGLKASFMPKPFMDVAGSGFHLHTSVLDGLGRNIFADPSTGDLKLRHCVAGLIESMAAATLVFVPSWNGYRRMQPGSYAPTTASWGHNNRSVGVRIPAGPVEATRLEHRIAGADANPYLVIAMVLAGMIDGLEREVLPPPAIDLNAYDEPVPRLPSTMEDAIRHFERSEFVRRTMGLEYRSLFAHLKRAEMQAFQREISPLERLTYL